MDKNETLEAIESARASHISQMEKIKALINGEKVDNPTAVAKTECQFGKWLYNKNYNLPVILGTLFYTNVEVQHGKWHGEYTRLFNIFFQDKKQGLFAKLLGAPKIDEMELDKAKLYYSELEVTTNELLKMLDTCERRVSAMGEAKFH